MCQVSEGALRVRRRYQSLSRLDYIECTVLIPPSGNRQQTKPPDEYPQHSACALKYLLISNVLWVDALWLFVNFPKI